MREWLVGRLMAGILLIVAAGIAAAGCSQSETQDEGSESGPIPSYTVRVVNVYPHRTDAFTQGLLYHDGFLYESTGQRGHSSLRKIELDDGSIREIHELDERYFGEGIAIVDDRIIQLTWQSQTGFVYDLETLERIGQFQYLTQGWGLTYDGSRLIMSDGTSILQVLDPETYEYLGFIRVRARGTPVEWLNELEYVDGKILANVWPTDRIVQIDPETGNVTAWVDASGLLAPEDYHDTTDVLNGIAWDAAGERLFLTGKYWPKVFEVELVPAGAPTDFTEE